MNKPIHYVTKRFKAFREDRGWSQAEMGDFLSLATGLKISQVTVAYWEQQTRGMTAERALGISKCLKIPPAQLFEQKGKK